MKITAFAFIFSFAAFMNVTNNDKNLFYQNADTNLIQVSQQLLLAAKTKEPTDSFVKFSGIFLPTT